MLQLSEDEFKDYFIDFQLQDTEKNRKLLLHNLLIFNLQQKAYNLTQKYTLHNIKITHNPLDMNNILVPKNALSFYQPPHSILKLCEDPKHEISEFVRNYDTLIKPLEFSSLLDRFSSSYKLLIKDFWSSVSFIFENIPERFYREGDEIWYDAFGISTPVTWTLECAQLKGFIFEEPYDGYELQIKHLYKHVS